MEKDYRRNVVVFFGRQLILKKCNHSGKLFVFIGKNALSEKAGISRRRYCGGQGNCSAASGAEGAGS